MDLLEIEAMQIGKALMNENGQMYQDGLTFTDLADVILPDYSRKEKRDLLAEGAAHFYSEYQLYGDPEDLRISQGMRTASAIYTSYNDLD